MKKTAVLFFSALVFLTVNTGICAATRLLHETFDDQVLDSRLRVRVYGAVATPPQYAFASQGRDGTGHCFSSGTVSATWLQWPSETMLRPWPSDELYVSFWMRYPTFTRTDPNENIKFFYPHWNGTSSYVHYCMYDPDQVYYSAQGMGAVLAAGVYLRCPNQTDGRWHRYEFYVKFSEGISRFWYDGVKKLDQTYGPGVWSNDILAIDAPSLDGEEPGIFSRTVDDLDIWDGMPDGNR
ncbi:MAG TPA: hypothetical protein PLA83_08365 [Deltaproteobacteria bacterium]|nr:hypothetical protein [Deltaproteobacteria bacterium]HQI00141.1 hypothetical protein [Deltaproteobacteria bacterium]